MMKALLLSLLYITVSCGLECESANLTTISPDICHKLTVDANQYCCYYEGTNDKTKISEKFCWAFRKEQIDNKKVTETIAAIEKGTDSHVDKPHSGVKLDCFGFLEKFNPILIFLLLLV